MGQDSGVDTLLFDIGGVVLSNAWDREQRTRAATEFALDAADFEARHALLAAPLERGEISFGDYLAQTVFQAPRAFTATRFIEYVQGFSQPDPAVLALLGELAARPRLRLATLNNEGAGLNRYRIEHFGLRRYFSVFCSSCYLGARKPEPEIYRRALGILQADPAACLFIDDREENLAVPRALGLAVVRFESAAQLRLELGARGLL